MTGKLDAWPFEMMNTHLKRASWITYPQGSSIIVEKAVGKDTRGEDCPRRTEDVRIVECTS